MEALCKKIFRSLSCVIRYLIFIRFFQNLVQIRLVQTVPSVFEAHQFCLLNNVIIEIAAEKGLSAA
jgi:hypothetical protein